MFIYIHGFNSSPASHKSNLLRRTLASMNREHEFSCPPLSHWPDEAMAELRSQVMQAGVESVILVGSSLGGYYATWLTENLGCKSVLINPAITPFEGLRAYLGPQKNLYTGHEYVLTEEHLAQMQALYVPEVKRVEQYLLIHTTGDELLDWRIAVDRFQGCRQIIVDGSDHGFAEFSAYVDSVLDFANT